MATRTHYITFDKVLRGGGKSFTLVWPDCLFLSRFGPWKTRQEAWEFYVRVAREVFFHFEPEKPIVWEESIRPTITREWSGYEI